ncbi:hypothetical protein J7F01_15670 [Streptomyces sp. ISL-22]|uniref:hypothetical protein n=1 Tax=unclassified Streptomyces TaxID=2593676 RepID=UPI001BE68CFE|nr:MULTISPECIES: hypothetical protein [unclassified Streptomyces]MBT2419504.1 hypothetical protein [Streptomyces sp. ISL-24]MBT2433593.1 hypothetical protein [Streptomyces sp. ISL-22]
MTVEESRASRYEDGRKQSYATFRARVEAAFDALTDLVADLRNDRPASGEAAQRAVGDVRKSLVNDVVPCLVQEVNVAADSVYVRLAEALTAASGLLSSPHEAKDANSPSMVHLSNRIEEVYVALKLFSHLSGEAIYGR